MHSLRTRLALGTAGAMVVVLVAGGGLLYLSQRRALISQLDRSLTAEAGLFASTTELDFGEIELDFEELDMGDFEEPSGPGYLQVWSEDGSVAYRSPSLAGTDLPHLAGPVSVPVVDWVPVPGGVRGRAAGMRFVLDDGFGRGPSLGIVVARATADLNAALDELRWLLLTIGILTVLLAMAALYAVVLAALRPLDAVAAEIGALAPRDLSSRVGAGDVPNELRPVVDRLNELLEQLEDAFRREKSFSADVAHELRTPLAGIRSTVEVTLAGQRQAREYRDALDDVLHIANDMQGMVEKLMAMARLEAGQMVVNPAEVSVNDVLETCWQPLAKTASTRDLRVKWELADHDRLTTDRPLLEIALRNVLENAVRYAGQGAIVEVRTQGEDSGVRIDVCNSAASLSPGEARHVFERFWRGDAARSDAGLHAGLGLPLVRTIAEALGGTADATSNDLFCVSLWVPERWPPLRGRSLR
jgi:two-component system sensor histidine kinase QseC